MRPPLIVKEIDVMTIYHVAAYDADGNHIIQFCDKDAAAYIVAAVNACHRLGLTAEQLEADAIGKLVEQANSVLLNYYDDPMRTQFAIARMRSTLKPFQKETP